MLRDEVEVVVLLYRSFISLLNIGYMEEASVIGLHFLFISFYALLDDGY